MTLSHRLPVEDVLERSRSTRSVRPYTQPALYACARAASADATAVASSRARRRG